MPILEKPTYFSKKSVKNALFETPSRAMHLILLTLEECFAFAIKPSRKTFYEVFLGMLNHAVTDNERIK